MTSFKSNFPPLKLSVGISVPSRAKRKQLTEPVQWDKRGSNTIYDRTNFLCVLAADSSCFWPGVFDGKSLRHLLLCASKLFAADRDKSPGRGLIRETSLWLPGRPQCDSEEWCRSMRTTGSGSVLRLDSCPFSGGNKHDLWLLGRSKDRRRTVQGAEDTHY